MADESSFEMKYHRYTFRKLLFVIICTVAAFLIFWISVIIGTRTLDPIEVYTLIWQNITNTVPPESWYDSNIVWNYRVPRALMGILCGAILGISGAVMQSIMKNPLADPYTTGVSSGSLFGMAVCAFMGYSIFKGGLALGFSVTLSIIMAMVPVAAIIAFAPFFRRSPASLILAGIAISYLFNALTTLLLVTSDADTLAEVYEWQVGSLAGLSWSAVPLVAIVAIVGSVIIIPLSSKLNLMALDDHDAKALGLNVERLRIICLVVIAVMCGVAICYTGIIGFVGLIIPHMTRLLIGSDNRFIIPASAALGAVFLLGCDVITRALDVAATIPVGVITGLIGAPIFLYLIIRSRRVIW